MVGPPAPRGLAARREEARARSRLPPEREAPPLAGRPAFSTCPPAPFLVHSDVPWRGGEWLRPKAVIRCRPRPHDVSELRVRESGESGGLEALRGVRASSGVGAARLYATAPGATLTTPIRACRCRGRFELTTSAAHDDGLSPPAGSNELLQIVGIARVQHVTPGRGDEGDVCVTDVRGPRAAAKFADVVGELVERSDDAASERARQSGLRRTSPPHLRENRSRDEHVRGLKRSELENRPEPTIVPLEGDERPRIQYDAAHFRRGLRCCRATDRSSSSVSFPYRSSHSRTTFKRPSARSLRRAASANQAEVGWLPADRRTARASSSSNEMASRLTVILRY